MVTDGLRALLLEGEGYEAKVFEFVSLEHTSKNKMILAVRHADATEGEGAVRVWQIIPAGWWPQLMPGVRRASSEQNTAW